MTWTCSGQTLECGRRFVPLGDGRPVRRRDVASLLSTDGGFRSLLTETIRADAPAVRFETPAFSTATADRDVEFVLLDAPSLDRPADPTAFAGHFTPGRSVVSFANLGNDAVLVVPAPVKEPAAYAHLAAFIRNGPPDQVDELWRVIGLALAERVGEKTVWLSTAGMGVPWLHVRIDDRPKYYGHAPYRTAV